MTVNLDKPERWQSDIAASVDFYNNWFLGFAPKAFLETRKTTADRVEMAIKSSRDLTLLTPQVLKKDPGALAVLRMATAPPLARDRLCGLAHVNRALVQRMEENNLLPARMSKAELDAALQRMCDVLSNLLDRDIFPWLAAGALPTDLERDRAATVVADRLTGVWADPIIRNAQERRQLKAIEEYLIARGYKQTRLASGISLHTMPPGTFAFRYNVIAGKINKVRIPVDVIVQPIIPRPDRLPILIEAKSAGDYANVNKRKKEEAKKMGDLKATFGENVPYILFLNGYFDLGYLQVEAAAGIDWVWEHRIGDLEGCGL